MCTLPKGFTLFEFLLYVSLATVMLGILGEVGIHVLSARVKAHALYEVGYAGQFVDESIHTLVTSSEGIISPLPGESASSLVLAMSDTEKNPTVVQLSEGVVEVTEGNGSPYLISHSVYVPTLQFLNVTQSIGPDSVRYWYEVTSPQGTEDGLSGARLTLYATVSIRK